ncbi:LicD family protein [Pelistega ratti]|uniref:LicD family protein n=1 Tax=Pelistega ratti TaxID=2652177 RepID=UPI00135AD939|nr:LicD family protein [Pelistega ratti]
MSINTIYKTLHHNSLILIDEEKRDLIKKELLIMMNDLNEFFKLHNIQYSLGGGSMLGAIRHQGFIPWDDDMDINMKRSDFSKFYQLFQSSELSKKYELVIPGDKNYYYHFPRLMKRNSKYRTVQDLPLDKVGLPIDIFILENISDNKFKRFIHGTISTLLLYVASAIRTHRAKKQLYELGLDKKYFKKIWIRTFLTPIFSLVNYRYWFRLMDRTFSLNKTQGEDIVIPTGRKHFWGEIYSREKMENITNRQFESFQFSTYKDESYYLHLLYGDYMKIPEDSKKEKHSLLELVL